MRTIGDHTDWIEAIDRQNLFKYLEPGDRQALRHMAHILAFEADELIVAEGDLSPSFFMVLAGTVKVHVKQDDKEVYICSLGENSSFGEASLFSRMLRTASVSALDDAVVLKLTRYDVMAFLRSHPAAGNKVLLVFINGLMKKLREANRELAYERRGDAGQMDVDSLIAELTGQ